MKNLQFPLLARTILFRVSNLKFRLSVNSFLHLDGIFVKMTLHLVEKIALLKFKV